MSSDNKDQKKAKNRTVHDSIEGRLEQAVRLDKFFSRLFEEVLYLHADTIVFRSSSGQLNASVCRASTEIKSIGLKISWYEPIVNWLSIRACKFSADETGVLFGRSLASGTMVSSFRLQDRVVTALVKEKNLFDSEKTLELSQLSAVPLSRCLEQLGITDQSLKSFQKIIDYPEGLLLLGAPNQEDLKRTTATLLSLSNAYYAADLENLENCELISKIAAEQLVVIRSEAEDVVELLFKAKRAGFNLDSITLAGVFCGCFVRRNCSLCLKEKQIKKEDLEKFPATLRPKVPISYPVPQGCPACQNVDHLGFIGLQSMIVLDPTGRRQIGQKSNRDAVAEVSYGQGTRPMVVDGIRKVCQGLTSFEDLFAVVDTVPKAFQKLVGRHDLGHSEHATVIAPDIDFFMEASPPGNREAEEERELNLLEEGDSFDGDSQLFPADQESLARDKPLLLVVEDDEDQRGILEMVLKMADYDVLLADNGISALEVVHQNTPDLIITDLMMPQMDGADLVKSLRENKFYEDIPILVLTVVCDGDKEYTLLNLGADDYCEKTIQRKILLQRIENLLRRTGKNNHKS